MFLGFFLETHLFEFHIQLVFLFHDKLGRLTLIPDGLIKTVQISLTYQLP